MSRKRSEGNLFHKIADKIIYAFTAPKRAALIDQIDSENNISSFDSEKRIFKLCVFSTSFLLCLLTFLSAVFMLKITKLDAAILSVNYNQIGKPI